VAFEIDIKKRKSGAVDVLHDGRIVTQVVPDQKYPGMYRVLANGELSDMVNISRAVDAARMSALSILNRNGTAPE